jgi:hypothetical protein
VREHAGIAALRSAQYKAPTNNTATKGPDAKTTAALVQDDGRRWEEELHCKQHESLIVCLRDHGGEGEGREGKSGGALGQFGTPASS